MSRLRINSKKFKEYHQNRLDEKNRIVKEQLQEEQRKLKEKNKKEEIKIIFESNKFNWRKENLREFGEWAPIEGSGPTNSTSTTFGYFAGGEQQVNYETGKPITFTYSGLNGVENYPTSITIDQGFGEVHTTDAPPFSAIGVQGYTAKLNPKYKAAQEKYKKEIEEWKRKEKQQESDIEETLKSFGTSWKEVRKGGGITKVGNSYVAIINTDSTDFGSDLNNNVRVVRLVPCDASQPMILQKRVMVNGAMAAWNVTNAQYSDDVYLEIGKQPKEPIESQYLMPRRIDFKNINPQLEASQEFAQKVGADYMMNARVQDTPEQPTFDANTTNDPNNPEYNKRFAPITAIDELSIAALDAAWSQITKLYPDLSWTQKLATDYARGNLKRRTVSPSRMFNVGVLKSIEHNLGIETTPGAVSSYRGMNPLDTVLTATSRLSMGRYSYKVSANGIEVTDFFDFGQSKSLGVFGNVPGLNQTAERIVDLGQRRAAEKGFKMSHTMTNRQTGKKVEVNVNPGDGVSPDNYGIPIKFTIPWSQVSPELQNRLDPNQRLVPIVKRNRRGRVVNR
tara:strand:+ start:1534 stop:3225 length:1692 start_codon:yes stop_codon:yes gene_type:complete